MCCHLLQCTGPQARKVAGDLPGSDSHHPHRVKSSSFIRQSCTTDVTLFSIDLAKNHTTQPSDTVHRDSRRGGVGGFRRRLRCRRQRRGIRLRMMQAGLKHHQQPSTFCQTGLPLPLELPVHLPRRTPRLCLFNRKECKIHNERKDNPSTQSHFVGLLDLGIVHLLHELPHARLCSCLANTMCTLRHFVC